MNRPNDQLLVRGTAVHAALQFVDRYRNTPEWEELLADLTPEERPILEEPIRHRAWYSVNTYSAVLDKAAARLSPHAPEELLRNAGHFILGDGVNSIYRAFFAIASPRFVIRGSAMLWRLFFKGSKLRILDSEKTRVHVAITEAPYCTLSLCTTIAGGMIASLEHARARSITLDQHRCKSGGGKRCDFHLSWR